VNANAMSTVITAIQIMGHVPSAVFSLLLIKTPPVCYGVLRMDRK
jgi:hypothetical protein